MTTRPSALPTDLTATAAKIEVPQARLRVRMTTEIVASPHLFRPLATSRPAPYKPPVLEPFRVYARTVRRLAQVAQLVEHVTENHGVGGSIPPLGTMANN